MTQIMTKTKKIRIPTMDAEQVADQIGEFMVRSIYAIPNFTGGIAGLSGGVDSTVTAALAKRAFENKKLIEQYNTRRPKFEFVGYILPSATNSPLDAEDGEKVANRLGVRYEKINIQPVVEAYKLTNPETYESNFHKGNLMSEIRGTILHGKAATEKKLLFGTGNRDEDFCVGYYTLFGDGAVHVSPIGNLPKRLVKDMARYLGFADLADRIPTAGLEPGQTDFKDLGYRYETAEIVMCGREQGFNTREILCDDLFFEYASEDLKNYEKMYNAPKFGNIEQIIMNVLNRNIVAVEKAKIVHPPAPEITLRY